MPYKRSCFDINHLRSKSCNHRVRGSARKCIRVQGSDRWLQPVRSHPVRQSRL